MIKFKKTMTLAMTLALLGSTSVLPIANNVIIAHASTYTTSSRISLGSYNISVSNVKAMAQMMRSTTGPMAMITEALAGCLINPILAVPLFLATSLSANAQAQTAVEYAADNNMMVRVEITDDANCHTSYSEQVIFTATYF